MYNNELKDKYIKELENKFLQKTIESDNYKTQLESVMFYIDIHLNKNELCKENIERVKILHLKLIETELNSMVIIEKLERKIKELKKIDAEREKSK